MPDIQDAAHRFPYLTPNEGEGLEAFLSRAATAHSWPNEKREEDLSILADLLILLSDKDSASRFGAYILRALSFAADSSMALRHLDRYLRNVTHNQEKVLSDLRDNPEHLHFLCSFFSFSQYLSEIAITHPEYLDWIFRRSRLHREKQLEHYREELVEWMKGAETESERNIRLTQYKKREQLRIGIRDLREMGDTRELCHELSNMAQAITEIAYQDCYERAVKKYGEPKSENTGELVGYCIYGMGKLGAGELNFSSDLDLIFIYSEEGQTDGVPEGFGGATVRRISNHEFYSKMSQDLIKTMNDPNPEGFMFRIDARLRPEGIQGPLVRSLAAYVAYLNSQAGQWERIAYQKARCLVGSEVLAENFDKVILQFVYQNNSKDALFSEVARLKRRIDFEALDEVSRGLDIKRGTGGIREIEFIVSAIQLLAGENNPAVRLRPTIDALDILVKENLLPEEDAKRFRKAYDLFRRVEHTLQMMHEAQTHRMPSSAKDRMRLAIRCGYLKREDFERDLSDLRDFVRRRFEETFHEEHEEKKAGMLDFLMNEGDPPPEILKELEPVGLGDMEGYRALESLAVGTSEYAPSARGKKEFEQLFPHVMSELPYVAQPKQAVRQFDLLLRAAKGYTWVYELCLSNTAILKLFLRTLGYGSFVGRQLVAHPEWLDDLFYGDGLDENRTLKAIERLHKKLEAADLSDRLQVIRQWKQLEGFLIGVQEILAITSSATAAERTTMLAEQVLQGVADIAAREILGDDYKKSFPTRWAIIGLGGLGDRQVHLTGDLDIAIVTESDAPWKGASAVTWIDKVGQRVISYMSAISPEGQLWKVDARLRPEGKSGPLVAAEERFKDYYLKEAGLWEWQALTKSRSAAGDLPFGQKVLEGLYQIYTEVSPIEHLAPEIVSMRERMESATRLPRTVFLDLKNSPGGVIDIEFLVQYLQLNRPSEAPELFPLRTEEALQKLSDDIEIPQSDKTFLVSHLSNLRALQRLHRLLWETTRDHYPSDAQKQKEFERGISEQLMLSRVKGPKELEHDFARTREIYRNVFNL